MSLKSEIDRTELSKNNLVTIKEQTNTALTQNGFDNIENFSQLPKVLADTLSSCKKIAKQTLSETFDVYSYGREKTIKVFKPDFVPEYAFLNVSTSYIDGDYIDRRDRVILSLLKNSFGATINYNPSYNFLATYNYEKDEVYIYGKSTEPDGTSGKGYFNEIIFLK